MQNKGPTESHRSEARLQEMVLASTLQAVTQGDTALLSNLLSKGKISVNTDLIGTSLLHEASKLGHAGLVEMLLQLGADYRHRNCLKETALDLAMRYGRAKCVKLLRTAGANVEAALGLVSEISESQKGAMLLYLRSEVFPTMHWRETKALCFFSKHQVLRLPLGLVRLLCQYLS